MNRWSIVLAVVAACLIAACSGSSGEIKDEPPGMTGGPLAPEKTDMVTRPGPGLKLPDVTKTFRPSGDPGTAKHQVEGCATLGDAAGGEKFPAKGGPKVGAPVKITTTSAGLIVAHEVEHGCCLKARVDTDFKGKTVTINEVLSGQACACACGSTLKTAVRLAPGSYKVVVNLDGGQGAKTVHEEDVQIRVLMGR